MVEIRPRESVILATDFAKLVDWYRDVLGFQVVKLFEDDFHYCNLSSCFALFVTGIGAKKAARDN